MTGPLSPLLHVDLPDALLLEKPLHRLPVIKRHPNDGKSGRLEPRVKAPQKGQFGFAGSALACPEVQLHRLAAKLRKFKRAIEGNRGAP